MNKPDTLVEYGAKIDAQTMVTPPDVTELELEPGHPGEHDQEYIRRRKQARVTELFGSIDFDPAYNYKKQRRRK